MHAHGKTWIQGAMLGALMVMAAPAGAATPQAETRGGDAYIAGYVAAVLEREFRLTGPSFEVQDGVITVYAGDLNEVQQDKIASVLAGIRGVSAVRVTAGGPPDGTGAATPPADAVPPSAQPAEPEAKPEAPVAAAALADKEKGIEILPRGNLFDPLIADPRWAHFSASYQYFNNDEEVEHAGSVSFGETFGLLGGPAPFEGRWQLDFQAAVFGLFDLDSDSKDLINADYWVGLPLSYKSGNFAAMARVFHQSSHLGDEFLLRDRVDRVNLSYEAVDLKLSYNLGYGLRVYGGLGYLLSVEPSDVDPFSTQAGVEYLAPFTLGGGFIRPVAGVDVQNREESNFATDVSVRAGVQFESPEAVSQRVQLMLEYYNGRNPNGQFYDRTLEFYGFGLHVYF
jgi:hypothetical protein